MVNVMSYRIFLPEHAALHAKEVEVLVDFFSCSNQVLRLYLNIYHDHFFFTNSVSLWAVR